MSFDVFRPSRRGSTKPSTSAKGSAKPATSELAEQVGRVLAEARGERSRYAIVDTLGWSSAVNLLRLESGEDNPTLKRLEEVAAALGGHLEVRFVPCACESHPGDAGDRP